MRAISVLLTLVLSLVVVANLSAGEGKKKGKDKCKADATSVVPAEMLKGLTLTDEQKTKIEALKTEYAPKVKDAMKKMDDVLTADQKKARDEVLKADKAAGKKGPEVRKDVEAALKLTDEQKTKKEAAKNEMKTLQKDVRGKVIALLTPEQQEQVKKNHESHKSKDK